MPRKGERKHYLHRKSEVSPDYLLIDTAMNEERARGRAAFHSRKGGDVFVSLTDATTAIARYVDGQEVFTDDGEPWRLKGSN